MEYEHVRTSLEDGVFTLTLDRPKLNVINIQLDLDWLHALQEAEADPAVRVILQRANGRMFTAGHDLEEVGEIIRDLGPNADDWSEVYKRIWPEGSPLDFTATMKTPIVSAVHGQVVGQGVYQVLASDMVVAAKGTIFNMEVARTGGAAGVAALSGLLPAKLVNELFFLGRLTGEDLLASGSINRVVGKGELYAVSSTIAKAIARIHPSSVLAHKAAITATYARRGIGDFASGFEAIRDSHGNEDDNAFWGMASERGAKDALRWRDANFGPRA